jgi:uncharacterized protein DUF5338
MAGDRKTEWGAARQAFLAHLDEVARQVQAGTPLTRIHAALAVVMPAVSYKQFCAYVQRYIRRANEEQAPEPREVGAGRGAPAPRAASTKQSGALSSVSDRSIAFTSVRVPAAAGAEQHGSLGSGEAIPKRADIKLDEPGISSRLDPDPVVDRARKRERYC